MRTRVPERVQVQVEKSKTMKGVWDILTIKYWKPEELIKDWLAHLCGYHHPKEARTAIFHEESAPQLCLEYVLYKDKRVELGKSELQIVKGFLELEKCQKSVQEFLGEKEIMKWESLKTSPRMIR